MQSPEEQLGSSKVIKLLFYTLVPLQVAWKSNLCPTIFLSLLEGMECWEKAALLDITPEAYHRLLSFLQSAWVLVFPSWWIGDYMFPWKLAVKSPCRFLALTCPISLSSPHRAWATIGPSRRGDLHPQYTLACHLCLLSLYLFPGTEAELWNESQALFVTWKWPFLFCSSLISKMHISWNLDMSWCRYPAPCLCNLSTPRHLSVIILVKATTFLIYLF